jgi:thiol-disulfide isomerase/thioredoxin
MIVACALVTVISVATRSRGADGLWRFRDISGKLHAPLDNPKIAAIVLVFITTDCPVSNYYQPTLRELAQQFRDGVQFFLVHPNRDITVEAARKHAQDFQIAAPVVIDQGLRFAHHLGAKVTPEAFVIDRHGKTVYRGRINDMFVDLGKKRRQPLTHDLRDALLALGKGAEIKPSRTEAVGCLISFDQ